MLRYTRDKLLNNLSPISINLNFKEVNVITSSPAKIIFTNDNGVVVMEQIANIRSLTAHNNGYQTDRDLDLTSEYGNRKMAYVVTCGKNIQNKRDYLLTIY